MPEAALLRFAAGRAPALGGRPSCRADAAARRAAARDSRLRPDGRARAPSRARDQPRPSPGAGPAGNRRAGGGPRVPGASGRARAERVCGDRPRAGGDRAAHRAGPPDRRARGLRRRRCMRHDDHGPRPARTGCGCRVVPARSSGGRIRSLGRDGGPPGRAGHGPAGHGRLRDHGGGRGGRRAAGRTRGGRHRSPHPPVRRRAARLRDRPSGRRAATRAPSCAAPRSRTRWRRRWGRAPPRRT